MTKDKDLADPPGRVHHVEHVPSHTLVGEPMGVGWLMSVRMEPVTTEVDRVCAEPGRYYVLELRGMGRGGEEDMAWG